MRREYLQVDGLRTDAFVAARRTLRFILDLLPDLVKVCETLLGVQETAPFLGIGGP